MRELCLRQEIGAIPRHKSRHSSRISRSLSSGVRSRDPLAHPGSHCSPCSPYPGWLAHPG
jgi:hypothetical protein